MIDSLEGDSGLGGSGLLYSPASLLNDLSTQLPPPSFSISVGYFRLKLAVFVTA